MYCDQPVIRNQYFRIIYIPLPQNSTIHIWIFSTVVTCDTTSGEPFYHDSSVHDRHLPGQDTANIKFGGTRRFKHPFSCSSLLLVDYLASTDGKSEPKFYVLESPLNWGHGSEVQHSSIGGISASVIMWSFFLAAGQVMISHAWTVCTGVWLVDHHQPDVNFYTFHFYFFKIFCIK